MEVIKKEWGEGPRNRGKERADYDFERRRYEWKEGRREGMRDQREEGSKIPGNISPGILEEGRGESKCCVWGGGGGKTDMLPVCQSK